MSKITIETKLLQLYDLNKDSQWELHERVNPTQTVILEVVSGRYQDVVNYAISEYKNIFTIKELNSKRVNPYSELSIKELYEEKRKLSIQLAQIESALFDADPDYE